MNEQWLTDESSGPDALFLCTGNYYRSRFAEELFNHLARENRLSERSTSLGFAPQPDVNPGPISTYTLRALAERNIRPQNASRLPAAVTAADFLKFKIIIALSENEHRPMMQRMFPQFLSRVQFWQIEDLPFEKSELALAKIETGVRKLIEQLQPAALRI